VEYEIGGIEYHDLSSDPFEMSNTAGNLPPSLQQAWHQALVANGVCKGQGACWQAQHVTLPVP